MTRLNVYSTRLLWSTASLITALAVLLLVALACDEGSDIRYVNSTDETVILYIDGLLVHTLAPSETREALILKFSIPKLFEAKTEDGTVVFSQRLTWDDLKARQFRLEFLDITLP